MTTPRFVNLHAHTEASVADGLFHPRKWVEALKTKGFSAHAVTDHGSMVSLLPFYTLMRKEGMTPLMGVEFYFVNDPTVKTAENRKNSHIILIAKSYDGFRNLCRLSELSFTEGLYYKPRIGFEWLAKYSEGLVCLTACQGGVLATHVWREMKGRPGAALEESYLKLQGIFGDDLYVEFQGHNTVSKTDDGELFDSQAMINEAFYDRLRKLKGFQQVVTNDCHYILPEHAMIQKSLKDASWKAGGSAAAGDSATVNQDHFTDSLWLKSPEQIYASFRKYHEYLPKQFVADGMKATVEIFEKCNEFRMPEGRRYLPTYRAKENSKELFKKLTVAKLYKFLESDNLRAKKIDYVRRFKKEFAVIAKFDLEDYFLIVWDLIRFAKSKGIYTGLGRGSAAGCFISYLLDIVRIDPLEHKLLFERFLNVSRCESGEMPDIDLDFESDRRREIKAYIYETYGAERVCEIGTYGRMKMKTALIDFAKSMGIARQDEMLKITTGLDLDKEDALDLDVAGDSDPRLQMLLDANPAYKFAVQEIMGQIKSQGVHPAGVIICSEPIADITPVKTQKKTLKPEELPEGAKKKDAEVRVVTTQAEDKYVIAQGLMKVDLLGIKEYDVIRYVLENADTPYNENNYVEKIMGMERETPNKKVWKMFQAGKTEAVFQFASDGMKQLLTLMIPDSIKDLTAANALYRPACLENGWHTLYCKRKHGEEKVSFAHETVEEALGDTYGVIVFQEQMMSVLHLLGGLSLIDTESMRYAISKKDEDRLKKFKGEFVAGASEKIAEKSALELWDQIMKSANYSFNRSHSAAYATLAYISQFFKIEYPAHFWAAQIDWDTRKGHTDDMLINRRAAADMGISFVLPDINRSKLRFSVDGNSVVWSFLSVKGIGYKTAKHLEDMQPYEDFDDFYAKIDKRIVKNNNIQSLIYAGALDDLGDRRELLKILDSKKRKKGTKYVGESDEELMKKFQTSMGFFEMKIKKVKPTFSKHCITESELVECDAGDFVHVGGMITDVRAIKTKKGDNMGFVTVMDLDEMIEVTVFPKQWRALREKLREGYIVEISGTKSDYNGKQNLIELADVEVK